MNLKSHLGKISILLGILLFVPLGDGGLILILKFASSFVGFIFAIWAIVRKQYVTGIIGLLLNLVGVVILVLFMGVFALLAGTLMSDEVKDAANEAVLEMSKPAITSDAPPPPLLPPAIAAQQIEQEPDAQPMPQMNDEMQGAVIAAPEVAEMVDSAAEAKPDISTPDAALSETLAPPPALVAPSLDAVSQEGMADDVPVEVADETAPVAIALVEDANAPVAEVSAEVPVPSAMPVVDAEETSSAEEGMDAVPPVIDAPLSDDVSKDIPTEAPVAPAVDAAPEAPTPPAMPDEMVAPDAEIAPVADAPVEAPASGYSIAYEAPEGLEVINEPLDMLAAKLFEVTEYHKTASGAMIWTKGLWKSKDQSVESYIKDKVTHGYEMPFKTIAGEPMNIINGGAVTMVHYVTFYHNDGSLNPETVAFYDAGDYVAVLGLSAPTASALKESWRPYMKSISRLHLTQGK